GSSLIAALMDIAPWMFTLATVWMFATRTLPRHATRNGLAAIAIVGFGVATLFRWEGVDGRQRSKYSFRWSPTAEEAFLATVKPAETKRVPDPGTPARTVQAQPGDWTAFRGPEMDGTVPNLALADWTTSPPTEVWRRKVGPAWSGMIVVDGLLFTQEQRD